MSLISNLRKQLMIKLNLGILRHFEKRAENEEIEALQLLIDEKLRAVMEDELKLKAVESKLLNNKKFIAALVEEVKKAA